MFEVKAQIPFRDVDPVCKFRQAEDFVAVAPGREPSIQVISNLFHAEADSSGAGWVKVAVDIGRGETKEK